ncbi:MAG: universal stress protein [Alphaproteobacteria bacterium]|nr:universal stress protein [Alphaproteobacteria bacterium]
MYKDLLVHADEAPDAAARIEYAVRMAIAADAHLTALYAPASGTIPTFVMADIPPAVITEVEARRKEAAARLREQVESLARRHARTIEFREVEGDAGTALPLHARYCDLAIVGQGRHERDLGTPGAGVLADAVASASGRAALCIPSYGSFAPLPRSIVIAWNGSREAARAVNEALPLLQRAERVTVLSVTQPERVPARLYGADIATHLARHRVKAETATTLAPDGDIGNELLSRAADLGAELIVMGCYGHSRLRERVLGGATQTILEQMTVPVLLAH